MEQLEVTLNSLKIEDDLVIELLPHQLKFVQKCYIPEKIFKTLSVKPGEYALITKNRETHLCCCFCKHLLQENVVEVNKSVVVHSNNNNHHTSDSFSINFLNGGKPLTSVEIKIVFESLEFLSLWSDREKDLCDNLRKYIFNIFTVMNDCEISLECLSSAQRCGIQKLIVKCEPNFDNNYGYLTGKTKIFISERVIENQSDFMSKHVSPLYALENVISRLMNIVEFNEIHSKMTDTDLPKPTKQVLIVGPSGCGKSSIAPLLAKFSNTNIVSINAYEINSSNPGETESNLRDLFNEAFDCAKIIGKCIINLDEITNLCPQRKNKSTQVQRIITQTLHLLDSAQDIPGIIVIANTSKPENLDPSVRRHGRLETEIYIAPPTEQQRFEILFNLIPELRLNLTTEDVRKICEIIAGMTPGYVGADLKSILQRTMLEVTNNISGSYCADFWINKFRTIVSEMTPVSLKGSLGNVTTRQTSFEDLAGLAEIKKILEISILWPIKHPESFVRMGIARPKGILLYGPPGCAKTSLVRALACLGSVSLLSISAAELYSPYVGDAENFIVQLFQRARQNSPCLLFIDEIDALAGSRSDSSQKCFDVQERILAALLTQMDGVGNRMSVADFSNLEIDDGIFVIGATNRPDKLDGALLRPGRFDKHILVPPPDYQGRIDILKLITDKMSVADDVNLHYLSSRTELYSGADLRNLCTEAALCAMSEDGMDVSEIRQIHFEKVLSRSRPSLNRDQIEKYYNFKFEGRM